MKPFRILALVALAAALIWIGRTTAPEGSQAPPTESAATESEVWTCPMHAQIRLPDPGPCPVCGMDLVIQTDEANEAPRSIVLSKEAVELARIDTALVERRWLGKTVRLVGKVELDETAVRTISAWVPGRLVRLFVDYTGVRVQKGEHLVSLYSPELLTAQEELLAARDRLGETSAQESEFLRRSNSNAYESARQKLILLGLSEEQVDEIERRGNAEDHVLLNSPASGVVVHKGLDEGAYVQTGTPIYKIADFEHLWVLLDAYERDLTWLRYGQKVQVRIEAFPGETFEGPITFIDPVLDDRTRTAKVRVNLDNAGGRIKPGMFVRADVRAQLAGDDRIADESLAGKWISPMHPEVVKDGPGDCDVCGMDLVPAEQLGLVPQAAVDPPLVVPASAVLLTGKRAVVYVAVPDAERPTFEGREIELGARGDDGYIVRSGLREDERVVVQGAFRIDAAMQIRAKPSMMSMAGPSEVRGEGPRPEIDAVFAAYVALQKALAADEPEESSHAARELAAAVAQAGLGDGAEAMREAADAAESANGIEDLRARFEAVTEAAIELRARFGSHAHHYEMHCPMAFDGRGASWLQDESTLSNPYYGAEMLRCGSLVREYAADHSHDE